jgi:uncharacterized protein (TIGR02099 family)
LTAPFAPAADLPDQRLRWRWALRGFWQLLIFGYFAVALLILGGRHYLMPQIANQRSLIEARLSDSIGLPVKISSLSASWPGLRPLLEISGLQIHDQQGRPALAFEHISAEISWSSFWHFAVRLKRLEITAPVLDIRRAVDGTLWIAGLPLQAASEEADGHFPRWLLAQSRIVIRDARVLWRDEMRGAPPLELHDLHFDLRNAGQHHSFGLFARPAGGVASELDLRGNLSSSQLTELTQWQGKLFANLAAADLANWVPWVDLPFGWTQGHGDLRVWLDVARGQPAALIADLQLHDAAMRLTPELPVLNLQYLRGRLAVEREADAYVGRLHQFSLATASGISLPATDVQLAWADRQAASDGRFEADGLDLAALTGLARYLPFPAEIHERLARLAPRGQLRDFVFAWHGPIEAPQRWQVAGQFADLALAAYQELPGFSGISGHIRGNEESGSLRIASQQLSLELPTVFSEARLPLASLEADAGWRAHGTGGSIDFLLSRALFRNADANGEASGSYRYTGQGLGDIDLSARLTEAAGSAVWRYMPLVVNADARDWLRTSIVGGRSNTTTLRLKGPLAAFPFADGKSGIFQVKGNFQGATLNYAEGWPTITGIDGELLFEGVRMLIRARRGDIMGVALRDVRAEIAELDAHEELLVVTGQALGDTQKFFNFIEASPVGARIDHFTREMTAQGKGELTLKLAMPLREIDQTEVQGRYRFSNNQLSVMAGLPPLTAAQGEFGFTADNLQGKNLQAQLLGAPLTLDVSALPGGAVRIDAQGKLSAAALRQAYSSPLLDHLAGETVWQGRITVKQPGAEMQFQSALVGLSSSLPEPFNKSAAASLPLKLAGRIDSRSDQTAGIWSGTLGEVAQGRLQQAQGQWRGRIHLGQAADQAMAADLPARGIALRLDQMWLDIDAWRTVLTRETTPPADEATISPLTLASIDINSAVLHAIERDFHDVRVQGGQQEGRWQLQVDSRQARGALNWDPHGDGRLSGRFSRLMLPATLTKSVVDPSTNANAAGQVMRGTTVTQASRATDSSQLPAVDLSIDDFRLHDMAFGSAQITAATHAGTWHTQLKMSNEAAELHGEGRWRPSQVAPETRLKFQLDIKDAEKLLTRLGQPDAVRRGAGQIGGELSWAGAPFALDLPSLAGTLTAEISNGQFKKLEPGVGRLLGVLSLQSLPRRITLDFRDVFSEGFAFDRIAGSTTIERGLMSTEALDIRGPAAKVRLSGRANLVAETQDLRVRVQPAVGESIAVGAMLANPMVGAAVWLAQKALNDPLDQVFAYEYAITGSWADPHVEKLSRP